MQVFSNPTKLFLTIVAISGVSAIGGLVFNTMPLLLTALEESGDAGQALGNLTFFAGGGFLLGTLSTPFWSERVDWRIASAIIVAFAAISFLFGAGVSNPLLPAAFAAFGFFCALAIALSMRILGEMPQPERAFGIRQATELFSIGLFLKILPTMFVDNGGFTGAMFGLAAFTAVLGLGVVLVPKRGEISRDTAKTILPGWSTAKHSWIMLAIFLIYLSVNVGLFFFLGILAGEFGPTPAQMGTMFMILKWLGGFAALAAAVVGVTFGMRLPHLLALVILMIGVAGLFFAPNFNTYMISSWIWEFGFTAGCIFQTAAIARMDPTGKVVTLVPAAFGLSMMFSGLLAEGIIIASSAQTLYLVVGALSLVPALYVYFGRPPLREGASA